MPLGVTYHVLLPLALGAVALAFIALGLYALLRRRPFVIHARWMLAIIVVGMSPGILLQLSLFFGSHRYRSGALDTMSLIAALTMLLVIGFLALQMRGYLAFGTTQGSFRDALMSALAKLNLESQETLSSIRLPSVPAELQVAVQDWIGTGQLRLRDGGRPGLLADVARGMNACFDAGKVKTNMTFAVAYVILGVLMGALVVTMMGVIR